MDSYNTLSLILSGFRGGNFTFNSNNTLEEVSTNFKFYAKFDVLYLLSTTTVNIQNEVTYFFSTFYPLSIIT